MKLVARTPPAIDRMSPEARAIFVRTLADAALDQVLAEIEAERAEGADAEPQKTAAIGQRRKPSR